MYITNFEEILKNQDIDSNNYCLFTPEETIELIKMGYMPIGGYKGKFVFFKNKILECVGIRGSEINVSEYEVLS